MSLEPQKQPQPIPTEKKEQKSKRAQAEDLALQYKDLPYPERRTKIMELVPCSRSVAVKACKKVSRALKAEKQQKPSFTVKKSEEKEAPHITKPIKGEPESLELQPAEKTIEELTPQEMQEQLDLFQDMLRGFHCLIFADGGITDLLLKAGRPEKQVKQVSDQLYRWLLRRYSVEDLEKWDTLLLVASYGTLVGGIIKDVVTNRAKKEDKKQEKKETDKK